MKKKKNPLDRMFAQALKEGIVHIPVTAPYANGMRTYLVADTHRDDLSISQKWTFPSGEHDYDDQIPLYLIHLGQKQVEISFEKTIDEVIGILNNADIEVKSILYIQELNIEDNTVLD